VVVATANDPSRLDPAILRRPGRFDRVVAFPLPSLALRTDYLRRLSRGEMDEETIVRAARESDKLTFAQLREANILTGQRAFWAGTEIQVKHLISAIQTVHGGQSGNDSAGWEGARI
jgi:ATP-dependent 26S proteasome regulatory subunit